MPSFRNRTSQYNPFKDKVSIFCESYEIEESSSPPTSSQSNNSKQKKVTLKGTALIFNRPTRNKVLYTVESAKNTLSTWVGRPFLNSHDDSDVFNSIGHVTKMEIGKDGIGRDAMFYEVDIDPAEEDFIRKAKRKDIPHVSIQVLVSDVRRKESVGFGDYIEADIKEGLELSAVLIPGDWESNGVISEKSLAESFLGGSMKEELNDIIEGKKDKEKKEPMKSNNFKGGVPPAPYEERMDEEDEEDRDNQDREEHEQTEDLTTGNGGALIAKSVLPQKKKRFPEPLNKVTPDRVPPAMISKTGCGMEKIEDVNKKKTNLPDDKQEDQEAEFTYSGKGVKYWKKGGNNIPAPYPKGFKAESLSVWKHCKRPMIVGKNSVGGTTMFCKGCGKTITVNEGIWKETYKDLSKRYEFLKTSKILTRRK